MFRAICGIALLVAASVPLHAEEAKPNTLTPKEIEEGWILLFDGETTNGWTGKAIDKWTIAEGVLYPQKGVDAAIVHSTPWNAFELAFQYQVKKDSEGQVIIGGDNDGGESNTGKHRSLQFGFHGWADVNIRVVEGEIVARESTGSSMHRDSQDYRVNPGYVGLKGTGIIFRAVKLKPLNTKSLFNGKDLAGWKKFETDPAKARSEVTVTKDGCISLKNGPGDLQTTEQFRDFILQAECFCNGDRLNSGIFFRCLPDQYQQGYEAQIHNGFTEKPEKEYAIDEYDPETHKLAGTKKVKYTAIDYGTGGIYRRVPARRAVAKDKEWFTMTVVAHGRHIATWVNGIQVVDWTDNRPENDNARNGCKLGKGAISLQGHDATTDLSFRNIRIAELPVGEKK